MTRSFTGHIAGLGTTSGTRLVLGHWLTSPFGSFADVMVEEPDGIRTLVAPSAELGEFVASTYTFDQVVVEPVEVVPGPVWRVTTPSLTLSFAVGARHPVALPLRLVPPPVGRSQAWARAVDPLARRLMRGVRTYGSAGNGDRVEWYAARDVHRLRSASARWRGTDLGDLAPVDPPVRFGFGSAPRTPTLTHLTSYVADRAQ
ncbi:hypothetical protein [Aeromicrobium sp. IC_218]|uniref:hypothetical protein n=1 Tax=Aeromicrobium sp. IC_218 TaxID=2545468 RepID=UPI00103C55D3|nr:hypothetical protein [Aeromicrobium sp. IC_218]TCI95906.1 hypothetical protein E0W78_15850 [Aeromicrobium sp. IC_218]